MVQDFLTYVTRRHYPTKKEWHYDLDQACARHETLRSAYRRSKPDLSGEAHKFAEQCKAVLHWFYHGQQGDTRHAGVTAALDHIKSSIREQQ
jgi:hypothetical protein